MDGGNEKDDRKDYGAHEERELAPEDQPTLAPSAPAEDLRPAVLSGQETLPRSAADSESLLAIGGTLGPYRIIRLLGKGGMGEVYEADHTESGRQVALKVLGRSLGLPEDRQRFLREGKLAAQISHPHCVYIYGTDEIDGILVISMELVPGGTLKERLDDEGPLPVSEAVDAVLQMIDGLEAAEAKGVLHRDIKPANCFLDSDGSVKIGDFGLSISTYARDETQLTTAGAVLGTPAYASPEQLKGKELDVRSDIYSVGATLYWLLTGQTPFTGRNVVEQIAQIMGEVPSSPGELRSEVPVGLAKVILRCLEKDPAARFANYEELRAALDPFGSAELAPAPLGRRFAAGFFDFLVILAIVAPLQIASFVIYEPFSKPLEDLLRITLLFLYFAILEGLWGASLGKILFGLRLAGQGSRKPGFAAAAVRAIVFLAFFQIPAAVWGAAAGAEVEGAAFRTGGEEASFWLFSSYSDDRYELLALVLFLVMFSTARRRNGFTGIQGLASGTRVVSEAEKSAPVAHELRWEIAARDEPYETFGPYEIIGDIKDRATEKLLLGYDRQLDRKAWIHTVPPGTPSLPAARRDVSRPSRLRWLSGRRGDSETWDAYEWVEGTTLTSLLDREQSWTAVRRWLLDLSKEIEHAARNDSLPILIDPDRIWIAADGTAKLLDFSPSGGDGEDPVGFEDAQELLYRIAATALSGRRGDSSDGRMTAGSDGGPAAGSDGGPAASSDGGLAASSDENSAASAAIGADTSMGNLPPLPLHARTFLDDLRRRAFKTPESLIERIEAVVEMQPVVPRRVRLGHFAWWAFPPLMMAALIIGASLTDSSLIEDPGIFMLVVLVITMALLMLALPSLIISTIFRGGLLFRLTGVAVVNRAGSLISRRHALWRTMITWGLVLPATVIVFGELLTEGIIGRPMMAAVAVLALQLAMLAGAIWCIIVPERGPQDHLARTYLVPR